MSKELFAELRRAGVVKIVAEYCGSGDDGSIQDINYEYEKDIEPVVCSDDLEERVHLFLDDQLPSGWEINEGSSGTIIVDFIKKTVDVDHNWIIEDTENEQFSTPLKEFE